MKLLLTQPHGAGRTTIKYKHFPVNEFESVLLKNMDWQNHKFDIVYALSFFLANQAGLSLLKQLFCLPRGSHAKVS